MSEIYGWLRRTDLKLQARPENPVETLPEGPQLSAAANGPEVDSAKHIFSLGPSARVCGRFDMSAADYQIRSVLDPQTLVGEQFRLLRVSLSTVQKQRGIRTLLVTSSTPREGKTFTACALAGVLAQEPGRRVVLVDADLRRPSAAQRMGLSGTHTLNGLSGILRGETTIENVLWGSNGSELFFLPSGPIPDNPSELLSTPAVAKTLRSLSDSFDWVVIDSPPVLALADATVLSPVCEAILLVARADSTPSKLILESIQRLGREKICGVVMNRVRNSHFSRHYYNYYGRDPKQRRT
jgi:capsular exopolysaccharide synthesis family protein